MIAAAGEVQQPDVPELHRLALGLQADVAGGERRAVDLDRRVEAGGHAAADLRCLVLEHQLLVDVVADVLVAEHLDLHRHPLAVLDVAA